MMQMKWLLSYNDINKNVSLCIIDDCFYNIIKANEECYVLFDVNMHIIKIRLYYELISCHVLTYINVLEVFKGVVTVSSIMTCYIHID